ncbi:T9SS type A sorting domain-containing protein [Flavobacterium sp.]|uniref:T9SS type A sorting domain-containing protein n=1 Tax=Flavobacterium sp. TaxID=239 RepID=UPI0022C1E43B|nr:T9SS type A sorting domain-containing protein [Flavobacterium sp.]MCZ8090993.1 T9SS type A sorting domain-containing protein [Flavobacterium sp.]
MIKKPFYFVFFVTAMVLLVQNKSYSQDILWEKSYGGKHAEYLFDVLPTPDYGFILAGSSLSKKTGNKTEDNRGDLDYWVWKMDEKGDLDWQKSLGGSGQDLLKSVVLTNEGGFLLAGSSLPNPSKGGAFKSEEEVDGDYKGTRRGQSDFWIIKLNAKGGEEWQKTIGGSGQDDLTAVVRTRDGGFVVGGSSASQPNPTIGEVLEQAGEKTTPHYGGLDYWVMKLDKDGKIVWQQSFGGKYNDELRSIALTEDGGFLLGGSSNSPESGNKTQKHLGESDYWIIKLDKDGNEQWQKIIGSTGDDQLYAIHTTKDGHYLLAGNSNSEPGNDKRSSNDNGTDFWVVKLDKDNKDILWQETYNIAKVDILTSVVENDDSTILLGGYAQGEVVKGKSPSTALRVTTNSDEKVKKGTADYVVIKIDANGEEKWRKDVGSDGEDILKKVVETRDGGYLMAGTSKSPLTPEGGIKATGDKSSGIGRQDFWVVKLKDKNKKKEEREKIEAIPNPAVDYTNVIVGYEFEKGTATLVDLAGHVLQQFKITERTVPIDLQGLPEGIYIVNIKTDKGNDGVKVIKQRK